jgi:hypothetical protein
MRDGLEGVRTKGEKRKCQNEGQGSERERRGLGGQNNIKVVTFGHYVIVASHNPNPSVIVSCEKF